MSKNTKNKPTLKSLMLVLLIVGITALGAILYKAGYVDTLF
ncbi:MAG: hypothetical protein Q4B28_00970 [bacterium]|nr:hypothetical protein [bacterium]